MTRVAKTSGTTIKEKLWLWRPVLLFTVIGLIIFVMVSNSVYTAKQLRILRAKQPIAKLEMNIGSDSPVTYVTILDPVQLDIVSLALQMAQEKDIPSGGTFKTWADLTIYKGDKKVEISIRHSVYHGWMIEVGSKTLTSDCLYHLVRRYSNQK